MGGDAKSFDFEDGHLPDDDTWGVQAFDSSIEDIGSMGEASPPDITNRILAGDPEQYDKLYESYPHYFSYSIWSMAAQVPSILPEMRGYFDPETVLFDQDGLGRFIAFIQGFNKTGPALAQKIMIPVLDIQFDKGFNVSFAQSDGQAIVSSFRVKGLGIGGSGGFDRTTTLSVKTGSFEKSCQLQIPAELEWLTYKNKRKEDFHVVKCIPIGKGWKVAEEDDDAYQPIAVSRSLQRYAIPKSGKGGGFVECRVSRGDWASFELPITYPAASSLQSSLAMQMRSESTSETSFKIEYDGPGGNIFGNREDSILFAIRH